VDSAIPYSPSTWRFADALATATTHDSHEHASSARDDVNVSYLIQFSSIHFISFTHSFIRSYWFKNLTKEQEAQLSQRNRATLHVICKFCSVNYTSLIADKSQVVNLSLPRPPKHGVFLYLGTLRDWMTMLILRRSWLHCHQKIERDRQDALGSHGWRQP